jgi:hypothetical protein
VQVSAFQCTCARQCAEQFTRDDIRTLRNDFWSLKESERSNHLVAKMVYDMNADYSTSIITFRYHICGKKVCGPFFCAAYPLSKTMFANVRNKIRTRELSVEPKRNDNITAHKTHSIREFMTTYIDKHGQPMPHKEEIHMPSGMHRGSLYIDYVSTFSKEDIALKSHAAIATFYHVLSTSYAHVKFPKHCAFSQCSTCSKLKSLIEKAEGVHKGITPVPKRSTCVERFLFVTNLLPRNHTNIVYSLFYNFVSAERFKTLRQIHLEKAALERKKFRKHWDKAKSGNPDKYMCVIIDGMTQNTTALPHFKRHPKWLGKDKYPCHVQGVMVAGRNAKMEFCNANVKKDANLNITSIHKAIIEEQQLRQNEGRPMPEVLYIQMDNVNSNKSKALFAWCAAMLLLKVFKKIKINFLLVGHTHENIDQLFSRLSIALRERDCLSLDEIMECAKRCMKKEPTVVEEKSSIDWKAWFEGANDLRQDFADTSFNHAFRVIMHEGKVCLQSRQYGWQTSSEQSGWQTSSEETGISSAWESEGIEVLSGVPNGFPGTAPLIPMTQDEFDEFGSLLRHLNEHLDPSQYTGTVQSYWEFQKRFQIGLRDGTMDATCVAVPFIMPSACTYEAPADMTREIALNSAPDQLLREIEPVGRPIYAGPRDHARAETRALAEDNVLALDGIKRFVVKEGIRQVCISWAPKEMDAVAFRINYGDKKAGKKLSEPLHLVVVKEVFVADNSVRYKWVKPLKFTDKITKEIGPRLAHDSTGVWDTNGGGTATHEFNAAEIVLSWEVDEKNAKLGEIPKQQFKELVQYMRAREIRLEHERMTRGPLLLEL